MEISEIWLEKCQPRNPVCVLEPHLEKGLLQEIRPSQTISKE